LKQRPLPGGRQRETHDGSYRLGRSPGLRLGGVLLLVLGCLLAGCGAGHDWTPGPEETSTRFLDAEVEEALRSLDGVEVALREDPEKVAPTLDDARYPLLRLRDYYLPLLQARGSAYNALRWYYLGKPRRTLGELEAIESILFRINDRGDPQLSRELDSPLETLVDAAAAVRAGRADAPKLLESLGSQIHLMLVKGGLALRETELGEG